MAITEAIVDFAVRTVEAGGYPGIAGLLILESVIAPIPSEAIVPFAGFLVSEGKLNLVGVIVACAIGSTTGSLLLYWLGRYGGRAAVLRFGRPLGFSAEDIAKAESFFQRHGRKAIFFSKFVPIVRHYIAIPAGIGRMPLGRFLAYTVLGVTLWNSVLLWLGYLLGKNWDRVHAYAGKADYPVAAIILVVIIAYTYRHWKKRRA